MTETTEFTDISFCQKGAIDWPNIGKSLGAVAIRSSQDDFIDSEWIDHTTHALEVGMPFFGWHFVQPDQGPSAQIDTALEAWNMLKWKSKCFGWDIENIAYTTNSGVKVNIEPPSKEAATLWFMQLLDGFMRGSGLSKKAMVIYTRKDYWEKWYLPSGTKFTYHGIEYTTPIWSDYSLWIAVWTNYTNNIVCPIDWPDYLMHQYVGGTNTIKYITGPADGDRFHGTYPQMIDYVGQPPAATIPIPSVVTIPYSAQVASAYLTVCAGPSVDYNPVDWLSFGTEVIVTKEQNGWGQIGEARWVNVSYLNNKQSIIINNPPIPLTIEERVTALELRVDALEAKSQLHQTFIPVVTNTQT